MQPSIRAEVQERKRYRPRTLYQTPPPPIIDISRRRFPVTPASPPHFHRPPAIPTPRSSPADFQLLAAGWPSWEEGRGQPEEGVDLPPPSPPRNIHKELSLSLILGATELCLAGTEDPEPAASAWQKAKHTQAGPTGAEIRDRR